MTDRPKTARLIGGPGDGLDGDTSRTYLEYPVINPGGMTHDRVVYELRRYLIDGVMLYQYEVQGTRPCGAKA